MRLIDLPPSVDRHAPSRSVAWPTAAFLGALLSSAWAGNAPLPQPIPQDYYQAIWTRSPFTVASASDEGPKGTWALVGLSDDADGPLVFLLNRQTQERITVTKTPNDKGFSIESVDARPDLLQSTAQVKTPAETLTVRFDQALTVVNNPAPSPASSPATKPSPPGAPAQPPAPAAANAASSAPGAIHRILTRTVVPSPLSPPPKPASP